MTLPPEKGRSVNRRHRRGGITRRDFIHDVTLAGLALGLPPVAAADDASSAGYPPTLTGLRGSHPGAFETAHALAREGRRFPGAGAAAESYDLVIVGAGISGLAAAYFFRQQAGAGARILLLDNHDDFGGHARRNEFHQGGPMRLAWGGTVNMEYWSYSEVGLRLLRELGIDLDRLLDNVDYNWGDSGTGMRCVTWFDRAGFGRDAVVDRDLAFGLLSDAPRAAYDVCPLGDADRNALHALATQRRDVLAHLDAGARERYLRGTPYTRFLEEHAGLGAAGLRLFSASTVGNWGVRAEHLSIAEALEQGLPGARWLGFDDAAALEEDHGPAAMFPDGYASIARLLVRALIADAFPGLDAGGDPFAIVTADLDYGRLDQPDAATRLRLNSTVTRVANSGDGVIVEYAREGERRAVSAQRCILACYNRIIPHICPELPPAQKAALSHCIKRPMGTVNVLLRDGVALQRSGIASAYLPGSFLQSVNVVTGLAAGSYADEWNPRQPRLLHFFFGIGAEDPEGLSMMEESQAGRRRLLAMSFEDFEDEVHRVLTGVWGAAGLDPERDILAITVNRWPHGYARDLMDLEEASWLARPGPWEIGRQPYGRISIANSDAGADAYTHTAIDQAWRAVNDL